MSIVLIPASWWFGGLNPMRSARGGILACIEMEFCPYWLNYLPFHLMGFIPFWLNYLPFDLVGIFLEMSVKKLSFFWTKIYIIFQLVGTCKKEKKTNLTFHLLVMLFSTILHVRVVLKRLFHHKNIYSISNINPNVTCNCLSYNIHALSTYMVG